MNLRQTQTTTTRQELVLQQIATLTEMCRVERQALAEVRKSIGSLQQVRNGIRRFLRDCAWTESLKGGSRPMPWRCNVLIQNR